jgi:hypothetical protein
VKLLYPDAGKMVYCLTDTIYQVVELFQCTNSDCELNTIPFNPTPRYDYGRRQWGVDVLKFIAEEFLPPLKQKPEQILTRLEKKYPKFEISLDSIARICDDIMLLKAFQIDQRTREIILAAGFLLLGFDGQDPGGDGPSVWAFMDLITGRILATAKFDSFDYQGLHGYLENLFKHYPVKILGWVSDKQGLIVKCHDTYYLKVPHQYCQYHFLDHLWDHLTALDSLVFMPLKKCLEHLYIHNASQSAKVFFEGHGTLSPRTVFKMVDDDFQAMVRARTKSFKTLRGVWIFDTLDSYLKQWNSEIKNMNHEYRFTKIAKNTVSAIQTELDGVSNVVQEVKKLQSWFEQIRKNMAEIDQPWQEIQRNTDVIFQEVYQEACSLNPKFKLEDCKAMQPSKNHTVSQVLGEWCRLWNSYLPGLFKYVEFPGSFRTNNLLEQAFSQEKQALIARVGKGIVGHMIETRGEAYLRLGHCDLQELQDDWEIGCLDALIHSLRDQLHIEIAKSTQKWKTMSREYYGFKGASVYFYPSSETTTVLS